ncbi:MAG: NHLP leader peptide family RiPP precursor [Deltaproteobacteria bacterium]|nr:NHLP leader peptide family RiPP precursor [Deltaproteobacteria bacterium]
MATEPTRKDLEPKLIARAAQDPEFRKKLVADPKAVIEAELGRKLPGYLKVQVVEETTTNVVLVLPATKTSELSDADLESVAGGLGGDNAWKAQ